MLHVTFNEPFFTRGQFPPTVFNGTSEITVPNPWGLDSFSAPFDQRKCKLPKYRNRLLTHFILEFYLIMNVAVGGTNGWFPDNVGDKPWLDRSDSKCFTFYFGDNIISPITLLNSAAMYDFARAQDTWYSTWPQDPRDRGMAV